MKALVLSLALFLGLPAAADDTASGGKCAVQRDARMKTRRTLDGCLKAWWDTNPKMTDPSDDCVSKLSDFVTAAKSLRTCRAETGK